MIRLPKSAPMQSPPRIRLSPPEEVQPQLAHIPTKHAHRWYSPFEIGNGAFYSAANSKPAPGVAVFMTPRAYVRCCAHAGSDLDNEVGGALVGKYRADSETGETFIVIEAALPARHTRQGSSYLTFTQDSLVAFHDDLDERYPGRELVGWFHTHPRMGIFLSGYDVWLHENFFPEPWQVALVIEPHSSQGGFFIRQPEGQFDPRYYFGFYELAKHKRRSVMCWSNLHPEVATLLPEGG
jgi:proteasome lid subunit RPN8/RPN11